MSQPGDELLWSHQPIFVRAPRPADPAWTLERRGVAWQGVYRGHGEWGWEFQLYRGPDFFFGRRYPTRAGAELEAAAWRRDIDAGIFDHDEA